MKKILEICVNGHKSAIAAERGGADRVELCAALPEGGTTPSYGEIITTLDAVSIPVNVIIRARGGDFLYSKSEIKAMKWDISLCQDLGANGVVVGALNTQGEVDMEAMRSLMESAEGLSVTFHRAFDMCKDPFKALDQIIELGCDRVLTSGQQATAEAGIPLLKELVEYANGRIIIMPGCGVNRENISHIAEETKAEEFHLSAKSSYPSLMQFRNPNVSMGGAVVIDEYAHVVSSSDIIKGIVGDGLEE